MFILRPKRNESGPLFLHKRSVRPFGSNPTNGSRVTNVSNLSFWSFLDCWLWFKGRKESLWKMVNKRRLKKCLHLHFDAGHDKRKERYIEGFSEGRSAMNIKFHRFAPFADLCCPLRLALESIKSRAHFNVLGGLRNKLKFYGHLKWIGFLWLLQGAI